MSVLPEGALRLGRGRVGIETDVAQQMVVEPGQRTPAGPEMRPETQPCRHLEAGASGTGAGQAGHLSAHLLCRYNVDIAIEI